MNKLLFFAILFNVSLQAANAQVGIGVASPDPSAMLDVRAINKGLLIPRMTTISIGTIFSPAKGLMVLDTVQNLLLMNTGSSVSPVWTAVGGASAGWLINGNNPTAGQYIGTNNTQPFIISTAGVEKMRIDKDGYIGLNNNNPQAVFDLHGISTPTFPQVLIGELSANNYSRMRFSNMTVPSRYWDIGAQMNNGGATLDNFRVYHTTAGNIFTLMGNGNAGFGTTDPKGTLEVKKAGLSTLFISSSSLLDSTKLILSNTTNNSVGTNMVITSRAENGLIISSESDEPNNVNPVIMHLSPSGNVGIGVSTPTNKLQVSGNTDIRNSGRFSMYNSAGALRLQVTPEETLNEGSQLAMYNLDNIMTIDIDADYGVNRRGRIILDEIQIKGGSDFAEEFTVYKNGDKPILPGMILSIDPVHEGQLLITSEPYDKKIAGVVSGANGIAPGMLMGQKGSIASGDIPVALAGRVYVLVTNEGGEILPGDLITSSHTKGYGMKAADPQKAYGSVIGKAMSKRNPETGYVLVLINLQ